MKRRCIITFPPAPIRLTFMQPCIPFRSVDSLFSITAKTLMGTIYTLAFSLHFIISYSFKSLCSDLCPYHSVQTIPANVTSDLQDIVNVNRWFSCPSNPLSLDTIGHSSLKSASLGFCCFPGFSLLKFIQRLLYCCLSVNGVDRQICLHPDLYVNSTSKFPPASCTFPLALLISLNLNSWFSI